MNDQIKEKLVQYQQVSEQIQQFNAFYQELANKSAEIQGVIKALEDIKGTKGKKMLVPISSGIFIHCEMADNSEVIVNVGANVCVKKPIEEARRLLGVRLEDVDKHMMESAVILEQLGEMEARLSTELEKYV